jgi:hypothetical protein
MDWCSVYLTPQALSKSIYLSPPLFFPTTSTELGQKTARSPGAAPLRWMGPNRNPRWSKSGLRVTLSYLHSTKQKTMSWILLFIVLLHWHTVSRHISSFRYFILTPRHPNQTVCARTFYCYIRKQRIFTLDNWFITVRRQFPRIIWKHKIRRFPRWFPESNFPQTNWRHEIGQCIQHGMEHPRKFAVWNRTFPFAIWRCIKFKFGETIHNFP